ncbi:hypothetical protein KJZ71_04110 [Patescibacteria group bacterium]|uniref:Transcription regulator TrmB N-terminal domain-containing protein n=1 Tax=candidate division WWE3 bacterium TaxID=2053526 RepID=A0A928TSD4_UNCKA|nr:hypothetical protein [candidate division WWE3 bacterium]MCL4732956.1 hypothetical protein [Patescibacteria group bacterium]MDL1952867.1 hypothetical protein [Candidatus Uhrbacteria bacterium UHB]RIL01101.1 MAG: hypothetical protein DCC77_00995 [Candidatus Uhrbacteria bacterium]
MLDRLARHLADAGLGEKEARVYLALLGLGTASAQDIAAHSDVHRATTYLALESLKQRGLVKASDQNKRTVFSAEHPERLRDHVREELQRAQEKERNANAYLPELEALFRAPAQKPVVRYFQGTEGLRAFREALANISSERCDAFIRLDDSLRAIADEGSDARFESFRSKLKFRFLYVAEAGTPLPAFPDIYRSRIETRIIPLPPFEFSGEIGLLDHVMYFVSASPDIVGCVVESPHVAALFRAQFDHAWKYAASQLSKK